MGATPRQIRGVAPAPGAHNGAALPARKARPASKSGTDLGRDLSRGPLTGLRVLEFTTAWAGPMAGRILAYLGAEAIHVESATRLDVWRQFGMVIQPRRYADREGGERTFDHPLDGFLRYEQITMTLANKPELTRLMEEVLTTDTKENWAQKLRHLPAGPIRTMKEALDEPEVKRRGMLKNYRHSRVGEVPLIGSNYHFSDTPVDDTRPPPSLGEHTDKVLHDLAGLGDAEIKALRDKKVVG